MKVFKYLALPVILLTGLFYTSCKPQDENPDKTTPPTATIKIDELTRTSVTFTITTDDALDFAYTIIENGTAPATAEEIFESGESGMFEGKRVTITEDDLEGNKDYTLYVAVRKVNPYVYSEICSESLSTKIEYTEMLTLDKIGYTDFTYHVEVPEGKTVKHISIQRLDYEAIKAIIGDYGDVTYSMYLATFGHSITESQDVVIDRCSKTALDDDIFVYSGTDFILMAGVVGADDQIIEDQMQILEFTTQKAPESPYNIEVTVEPGSNKATVSITPESGIVSYRVRVDTKREFDYVGGEGEDHLKSFVIGPWYDESNMFTEAAEYYTTGLRPNTAYVAGVVGFDAENGEVFKQIDFVTGEPVGPEPVVTLTQVDPSDNAPWRTAAVNTKVEYTIEARGGFFDRQSFENAVANGYSVSDVVWNNGIPFSADQLSAALSANGCISEITDLEADTEYVFGITAMNDEYVTVCDTLIIKTAQLPGMLGPYYDLLGDYIASTQDADGNTVTFPVTIATGVNAETTEEYSTLNRFVCLGFGPEDQFPYISPEEVGTDNPNADYGPKWFLEVKEGIDGAPNTLIAPSTCNPANTSEFAWAMAAYDAGYAYMWGYGVRPSSGKDTDANSIEFHVEVSEDGNTITIKGTMGEYGETIYYPTMAIASDPWWTDEVLFRCYSDLVLTRQ